MTERPIIFSAPMVRAILEGRKTQTRRIVKPAVESYWCENGPVLSGGSCEYISCGRTVFASCPYGSVGDHLWVRETFFYATGGVNGGHDLIHYRSDADDEDFTGLWKPSIHMPRSASRITLEIAGVRVERLQDISEEDAIAEGCEALTQTEQDIADAQISDISPDEKELARLLGPGIFPAKGEFQMLWGEIHGSGSWEANPWVWVIEFGRVA